MEYCVKCGATAKYHLWDEDMSFCEECFEDELNNTFKNLSVEEKMELLNVDESDIQIL